MKCDKIKLYVEEIYASKNTENTIFLIETTGLFQNEIIEDFIRDQQIDIEGSKNDRSFLHITIPCYLEEIKIKPEMWYEFPLDFFKSTTKYKFLNEDDIGSNLIRAELNFKEYPEDLAPKQATQPPKADDYFLPKEEICKLLKNHQSPIISNNYENICKKILIKTNCFKYIERTQDNINKINSVPHIDDVVNKYEAIEKTVKDITQVKTHTKENVEIINKYIKEEDFIKQSINEIEQNPTLSDGDYLIHNSQEDIILEVVNCGHGNWNELHTNSSCIFYDLGATLNISKSDIFKFAPNRFNRSIKRTDLGSNDSKKKNILIISHWDKDHYQSILNINESDLKEIDFFLAPLPKKDKLKLYNIKKVLCRLFDILGTKKMRFFNSEEHKTCVTTNLLSLSDNIILYIGKESKDYNKSGLILHIKGADKQALLPADHHWHQVGSILTSTDKSIVLVTPHHGGKAGSFEKTLNKLKQSVELCTSCDENKNNYNHPREELLNYIESESLTHKRTDNCTKDLGGSISYIL